MGPETNAVPGFKVISPDCHKINGSAIVPEPVTLLTDVWKPKRTCPSRVKGLTFAALNHSGMLFPNAFELGGSTLAPSPAAWLLVNIRAQADRVTITALSVFILVFLSLPPE
jgi:hypothetical protein